MPVIEMAGFGTSPSSKPAVEMAGFGSHPIVWSNPKTVDDPIFLADIVTSYWGQGFCMRG
jgi:hypothetical protein